MFIELGGHVINFDQVKFFTTGQMEDGKKVVYYIVVNIGIKDLDIKMLYNNEQDRTDNYRRLVDALIKYKEK